MTQYPIRVPVSGDTDILKLKVSNEAPYLFTENFEPVKLRIIKDAMRIKCEDAEKESLRDILCIVVGENDDKYYCVSPMFGNMLMKICTVCGYQIIGNAKFCAECGAPMKEAPASDEAVPVPPIAPPTGFDAPVGAGVPMKMGKTSPADDTLTFLAEYCDKTVATVGGDGYTEWVLNRRADGKLQIDYYRNYVGYDEEIHCSYPATNDTWDRITAIKEQYLTGNSSGIRLPGMCGGYSLVKIREGDSVIRLTAGNMTAEESTAFSMIRQILTDKA